jgi:hypothetical protein
MTIQYTYEIVMVDEPARCMEVRYSSDGRKTISVGARLPFEGESLEAVIQMYAPTAYWRDQERVSVVPAVGTSGALQENMSTPTKESAEDQFFSLFPTPPAGDIKAVILGE